MKTRIALLAVLAFALLPLAHLATAADEDSEFHALCPVSGGPAKKANAVDYKGKKVYFCCKNCPAAFEKEPAEYMAKVMLQWLDTAQIVQVGCPISGGKVNPDTAVDVDHAKVAFCCNKCKGKYEAASDEEKLAMLFGESSKGFTLQTTCPVSGKPIKADKSVEYEGHKVYFCCDGCPAAFEKDPTKFTAKLPQLLK